MTNSTAERLRRAGAKVEAAARHLADTSETVHTVKYLASTALNARNAKRLDKAQAQLEAAINKFNQLLAKLPIDKP